MARPRLVAAARQEETQEAEEARLKVQSRVVLWLQSPWQTLNSGSMENSFFVFGDLEKEHC